MKKTMFCFLVCLVLLAGRGARADDYLSTMYDQAMFPAKIALSFDECGRRKLLDSSGPIAEDQLRRYFDRAEKQDDLYKKDGVTGKQVADISNKAIDDLAIKMIKNPISLTPDECISLNQQWVQLAKQYGIQ